MLLLEQTLETIDVEKIEKQTNFFFEYVKGLLPGAMDFLLNIVIAILIYVIGKRVISFIRKIYLHAFERSSMEAGVSQFLDSLFKGILYFLLIVLIVTRFGVTQASITAIVGSAGLAIGLALQGSLENFAGGVLILIMKPFEVGDYIITASGLEGTVTKIQICYTKLVTIDNKVVVIPNGSLSSGIVTNVTKLDKRMVEIFVGVSYNSDLKKVKEVFIEVLNNDLAKLPEEESKVFVSSMEDSCIKMCGRVWVNTAEYFPAKCRLNEEVILKFKENHIEIPFPQMEVLVKNPQ